MALLYFSCATTADNWDGNLFDCSTGFAHLDGHLDCLFSLCVREFTQVHCTKCTLSDQLVNFQAEICQQSKSLIQINEGIDELLVSINVPVIRGVFEYDVSCLFAHNLILVVVVVT